MDKKRSFGEYIRRKRQAAGLTQRELAEQLYVAESTVSKWERGLSYPDVSLIPEVCRKLSISEHEFFTACDDGKAHAQEHAAAVWNRAVRIWRWIFAASYAVAVVVCFICDLAVFHRLDWFWIVLTSLMLAFSLTNLPLMVRKNRASVSMGAATVSLLLLLLACWLYTGGFWVLGGLAIAAVSLLLPWGAWAIWRFYGRHLPAMILGWLTVWTFLLLAVIRLFAGGNWLLSLAFPIAAYCYLFVWLYFAVGCWLRANRWLKSGVFAGLTAFLMPAGTEFGDRLSGGQARPKASVYFEWWRLAAPEDFEWINILIFVLLLALAVIFLIVGMAHAMRERARR